MRKSKEINDKLKELELLREEAEKEEKELSDRIRNEITNTCDKANVFCGVILTTNDLLSIVKLAIENKDNIKIPFNIYIKD